ncbi:hypothetical protein AC578_8549 [Lecanosticta acicola]|uniref:Zinc finger PHD-type domain-containing protein n=1 Tax=Lecanosticta acicola TaxID=111012 RepID=A0AAI9E5F7_9PEZI|nr:hypothetical protein AC578_8549 [Lecanosticta acicola]
MAYTPLSAVDWNFPSPSATPTNASFGHNVYNTPKTAIFPSHFADAFSTPQMPAYTTTPRQLDHLTMTPVQRQHASAETLRDNYYANVPASSCGPLNNVQRSMPPPSHTPTAYQGQMTSPVYGNIHSQSASAMSFDTSQMQTPPPTRGTSARKPTPPQQVAFGTPSTIASRRFVTPQQVPNSNMPSQAQHAHMPMQFPQLQFSSDVYQFTNLGPASAPVFPQTQLLWEQTASPNMYSQQAMLDDPFAPMTSQPKIWPPVSAAQQNNGQQMSFSTPVMNGFQVQQQQAHRPASAAPVAQSQPHLSPPVMTCAVVNPSLVYSSPVRPAMPPVRAHESKPRGAAPRPEPKRKDSGAIDHKRSDTVTSTISAPIPSKPQLRRSNTAGTTSRPQSAHPSVGSDSLSRSNSVKQPPRTVSPLKRIGKLPLGSISENKKAQLRRSVILTVDGETGLARTETLPPDDSPTKSIRDRYPALFDSDSSDEEGEEEDLTPSRSTSFSFGRSEGRKSKAAKLDPPVENLEGLSIPRSSSSASMKVTPSRAAISAAAQLRRGGSLRRRTPSRNGQRRSAASANISIDTAPMDLAGDRRSLMLSPEEPGHDFDWDSSSLAAHNRRWSMMSLEQQNVSPTHQNSAVQHTQASNRRPQQAGRLLRCSCGVPEERGQALVQCRSCTQWAHAQCVGLDPTAIPPTFTCFLCTKPNTRNRPGKVGSRNKA